MSKRGKRGETSLLCWVVELAGEEGLQSLRLFFLFNLNQVSFNQAHKESTIFQATLSLGSYCGATVLAVTSLLRAQHGDLMFPPAL